MKYSIAVICALLLASPLNESSAAAFGVHRSPAQSISTALHATKKSAKSGAGFGSGGGFGASSSKKKPSRGKGRNDLISALNDDEKKKESKPSQTYVKAEQEKCELYLIGGCRLLMDASNIAAVITASLAKTLSLFTITISTQ